MLFAERSSQRNIKKHISEPVELQLNKGTKDMWDEILIAFRNILTKAENAYLVKAKSKCGFWCHSLDTFSNSCV